MIPHVKCVLVFFVSGEVIFHTITFEHNMPMQVQESSSQNLGELRCGSHKYAIVRPEAGAIEHLLHIPLATSW